MADTKHHGRIPTGTEETNLVVAEGHTFRSIDDKISEFTFTKEIRKGWVLGLLASLVLVNVFVVSLAYLVGKGLGIWGLNIPVAWGMDIINFVWWIGIGHAGTLISAILLLFRQEWRTSINRFAEAMTLFAVACAAVYPVFHTGRPWLAIYWLFPYPNVMGMWPQFRSPLMWDVFAVSTYATVSLIFWYVGLVPDLASYRDRAKNKYLKFIYGVGALGWRGSARHWNRYEMAYLLLAGLSTPLVLSVHSIVSFDFAVSQLPGWHATIFPPYFVAGAIFAGFAMVATLMIPLRISHKLRDMITLHHLDNMAKVMLGTGLIVAYGYFMEGFTAWYSGNLYERFVLLSNRMAGPYWAQYWSLILCNVLAPQLLWIPKVRRSPFWLFFVSMFVNVGMWLERFVIIVGGLHRDFLPSSWEMYTPSFWDVSLFVGTIGVFLSCIFLFVRILPFISITEMKHMVWHSSHSKEAH